jgi:hypothetical protein
MMLSEWTDSALDLKYVPPRDPGRRWDGGG